MIKVMRILEALHTSSWIERFRIALWGGEEAGLLGSAYVQAHFANIRDNGLEAERRRLRLLQP